MERPQGGPPAAGVGEAHWADAALRPEGRRRGSRSGSPFDAGGHVPLDADTNIRIMGLVEPVRFMGSAKDDLSAFPKSAWIRTGHELFCCRLGGTLTTGDQCQPSARGHARFG
jgi:hypothetical protein